MKTMLALLAMTMAVSASPFTDALARLDDVMGYKIMVEGGTKMPVVRAALQPPRVYKDGKDPIGDAFAEARKAASNSQEHRVLDTRAFLIQVAKDQNYTRFRQAVMACLAADKALLP